MSLVTCDEKNGILTIAVNGRIDSSNASKFSKAVEEAREMPHTSLVFDFENLEYISSAGLRVLISTRKKEKDVSIINVSSDVYEILEMTGITEILDVKKMMRTVDVTGCKKIGEGAKSIIYQYEGDQIVKVYKSGADIESIERERSLARQALIWGVPTAIAFDVVRVNDFYGAVYELIDAESMSNVLQESPEKIDWCVKEFSDLLKEVHSIKVTEDVIPKVKDKIKTWISDCKEQLDDSVLEKLKKLVDECEDTNNLLHFDYHSNNIMIQENESVLIDLDTLCIGNPIYELANTYVTYVVFGATYPPMVEKFLGISYDTAKLFWDKFICEYLGTDNETVIKETMKKIELLSNLRQLRHYARRPHDDEKSKKSLEYSKNKVNELIKEVDSLNM